MRSVLVAALAMMVVGCGGDGDGDREVGSRGPASIVGVQTAMKEDCERGCELWYRDALRAEMRRFRRAMRECGGMDADSMIVVLPDLDQWCSVEEAEHEAILGELRRDFAFCVEACPDGGR